MRPVKFEPGPFLVSDPEYLARMGGSKSDPDAVRAGMPGWLSDSIIGVPKIEAFKEELKQKGML